MTERGQSVSRACIARCKLSVSLDELANDVNDVNGEIQNRLLQLRSKPEREGSC